jgi:phosphate transport system substrate-binding protein
MSAARMLAAVAMAVASAAATPAPAADISGAGATFPHPIYARWADAYKAETGVAVSYRAIGSSGGITEVQAKTVTFGASDMPQSAADLATSGLVQFPTLIGGVVPVMNVDGIKSGDLTLDGPTLARIFLGEIKAWNHAAIRSLNPGARLPGQRIAIVRRSDGSGTTFLFTDYLAKVSPHWRSKVGASTSVEWPVGIGADGNEGVADAVARTRGSIGYVEYAYARQHKLTYPGMINKDGKAVAPTAEAFTAAASGNNWEGTPGFGVVLTNPAGLRSWPITGATFILMPRQPDDPAAAVQALKFFAWAFANGGRMAEELDYVPMPAEVVSAIRKMWASEIRDAAGRPVFAAQ